MKTLMIVAAVLAATVGGCVVETHDHGPYRHRVYGPAVTFETGHVHSEYCGHYRYGTRWYVAHGHTHGPGCGHVFRSGVWVVID